MKRSSLITQVTKQWPTSSGSCSYFSSSFRKMLQKEDTNVISYSQIPRRSRMTNELISANDQYLYLDYKANQVPCQWKVCPCQGILWLLSTVMPNSTRKNKVGIPSRGSVYPGQ